MVYLFQQLANAIPLAALYAALAFGYSIAFGVTRRADLTYGAVFAFSGQMYVLFADLGWNRFFLILPAALLLGALAASGYVAVTGVLLGRYIMPKLVRHSPNAVIVVSLGMLIVLMETARLASDTRDLWLPPFLNGSVVFFDGGGYRVTLTVIQIINVGLMLGIVALGHVVLTRSRFGRSWQAVIDDPLAAELCGVNTARVFLMSYLAAAAVSGFCGILATSYYGNMDFGAGVMFGLKVLMIAAVGGYGEPLRSAAGAAVLGVSETLWGAYGPFLWRDPVVFSLLVAILVFSRRERPVL